MNRVKKNCPSSSRIAIGTARFAAVVLAALVALTGSLWAVEAAQGSGGTNGSSQPIDINKATAKELTAIPGIGEAIAQRIIDFRDKEGPFRRVEDLMKVKGIGEKSFQKIRPHVKVEDKG
jgi:competence protein ComEA